MRRSAIYVKISGLESAGFTLKVRWCLLAVRLKLVLEYSVGAVETIALLNSGYETLRPEILLPISIARELKLFPPPTTATIKEYTLADGSTIHLIKIPRALKVSVTEDDRVVGPIEADVTISEGAEEPLISDKLASKLNIAVLDFGEGIWCFRDEVGKKERKTY